MTVANFNPEEFGNNLARQAQEVVPKDLTPDQQNYVVNKVNQFCFIAGNALNQDPNLNLNLDHACTITQFIGEWTFHKSIDLIRSGLPPDCWDQVLQEVALAIFERAKQVVPSNVPPQEVVTIIEKEVNSAYEKTLRALAMSNKIAEDKIPDILARSNIDEMAKEAQSQVSMAKGEEDRIVKLASIAIMLKTLSELKREKILSSMESEDAEQIRRFMQIPDLEQKVDPVLVEQFLKDFKQNVPSIKRYVYSQSNNIMSLKELFTEIEIKNIVKFERKKIRDYVDYCLVDLPTAYMGVELSPQVSNVIANYIRSKLVTDGLGQV